MKPTGLSNSFPIVPVALTEMAVYRQGYNTALMQNMANESTCHHSTRTHTKKEITAFLTNLSVIAHPIGNTRCLYGASHLKPTSVEV